MNRRFPALSIALFAAVGLLLFLGMPPVHVLLSIAPSSPHHPEPEGVRSAIIALILVVNGLLLAAILRILMVIGRALAENNGGAR